jgi:Zinc knuckle
MNGNVFECYEEQDDRRQFSRTLEALEAHVKKTMKFNEDVAPLFADPMETPKIEMPVDPGTNASKTQDLIYAEKIKQYVQRETVLTGNMRSVYAVIWGQCSEAMKAKVKSVTDYKEKSENNDCVWLLKQIKATMLQFGEKRSVFVSLWRARREFANCTQRPGQHIEEYLDTLKSWADAIDYHGGLVAEDYELIAYTDDAGNTRSVDERKEMSRERTLATAFIQGADPTRYGALITGLSNDYAMGTDKYPTTVTAAFSMLEYYKVPINQKERPAGNATQKTISPESSAVTFAQKTAAKVTPGSDGVTHEGITCYSCQSTGHYASVCPETNAATNGEKKQR